MNKRDAGLSWLIVHRALLLLFSASSCDIGIIRLFFPLLLDCNHGLSPVCTRTILYDSSFFPLDC